MQKNEIKIGVLAEYIWTRYDSPRRALYIPVSDKYTIEKGWSGDPEEVTVIGEDDFMYITGTYITDAEWWKANKVPVYPVEAPLGFHKSRLVKWLPTQLSLF